VGLRRRLGRLKEEIDLQSSPKYTSFCTVSTFTTQQGLNSSTATTNAIYTKVFSIPYTVWTVTSVERERAERSL
jgi:hypothetical protein